MADLMTYGKEEEDRRQTIARLLESGTERNRIGVFWFRRKGVRLSLLGFISHRLGYGGFRIQYYADPMGGGAAFQGNFHNHGHGNG